MTKKIKESKSTIGFSWLFLCVGIFVISLGVFFLARWFVVKNNSIEIQAEIVLMKPYDDHDGDISYNVFVSYEYDGVQYKDVKLNHYDSTMYVGKKITIFCDKDNPANILSTSNAPFITLILVFMGGVFFTIGLVFIVKNRKKRKIQAKIKLNGEKIKCYISAITQDESVIVNGRYVSDIATCTPLEKYLNVQYDSNPFQKSNNVKLGDILYVYVNPNNLDEYYVDLNSLTGESYSFTYNNQMPAQTIENNNNEYINCSYCGNPVLKNKEKCPYCGNVTKQI